MSEEPKASAVDERVVAAVHAGDAAALATLLDQYPDRLHLRTAPYEQSLLHLAALAGHLDSRGPAAHARPRRQHPRKRRQHLRDALGRGRGSSATSSRRLADAGGDVIGDGDDHALDVIGWATLLGRLRRCRASCRRGLLVSRGARHHIFSAIALGLADDVRRIVAADPAALNRRMSRNENHQLPLHFAVRMNQPAMVALLMDLGADPLAVDGSGFTAAAYAIARTSTAA